MGEYISFRERTPGVCAAIDVGSIQAVSISEPRVKFVKGWLTGGADPEDGSVECGDSTQYPLGPLTVDQLAEIVYRVKDATWGGSILNYYQAGVDLTTSRVIGDLPADVTGYLHERSYLEKDSNGVPTANLGPITDEREMWNSVKYNARIGLSCYIGQSEDFYSGEPDKYGFYALSTDEHGTSPYFGGQIKLNFGDQNTGNTSLSIAWIDNDGSGDPFSAGNSLYLKMELFINTFLFSFVSTDRRFRTFYGEPDGIGFNGDLTYATFKLVIGANEFILPMYRPPIGEFEPAFSTEGEITLTATEWWPYAKLDGAPQWDSDTGARL